MEEAEFGTRGNLWGGGGLGRRGRRRGGDIEWNFNLITSRHWHSWVLGGVSFPVVVGGVVAFFERVIDDGFFFLERALWYRQYQGTM